MNDLLNAPGRPCDCDDVCNSEAEPVEPPWSSPNTKPNWTPEPDPPKRTIRDVLRIWSGA